MKEKTHWSYQSKTLSCRLVEGRQGVLLFYPQGIIDLEGIKSLFDYIREYRDREEGRLILLVDNSQISSIEMKARIYVVDTIARDSVVDKAASFGENILFTAITSIFTSIMSKLKLKHKVLKTEKEALDWASLYILSPMGK